MKILLLAFKPDTEPNVSIDDATGAIAVVGTLAMALRGEASMAEFDELVERMRE